MRESKIINYKVKGDEPKNDKEFKLEFSQLRPSKSLIFMKWFGKIAGGSLGSAFGFFKEESNDYDFNQIGKIIFDSLDRVDDDEAIEKINLLLSSVEHEGTPIDIDYHMFEMDLTLLPKVIKVALEVNYKRFLQGKNGIIEKIKGTIKVLKDTQKDQQ
jgi:hypothetical protein